jgi:hypothetical protein
LRISDEQWAKVAQEQEYVGHDRDGYAYALIQRDTAAIAARLKVEGREIQGGPKYLFQL